MSPVEVACWLTFGIAVEMMFQDLGQPLEHFVLAEHDFFLQFHIPSNELGF